MAKGAGSTRSGNTKLIKPSIKSYKLSVDAGYPSHIKDIMIEEYEKLDSIYGFHPDLHFVNGASKDDSNGSDALGRYFINENKIKIFNDLKTYHDISAIEVIRHEYGHAFKVSALQDLKPLKQMIKLNPNNEKLRMQYEIKKKFNEAIKKDEKMYRLNMLYKSLSKDPAWKKDYIIRGGFVEFVAESFQKGYNAERNGIKIHPDIKEAYDIIKTLPFGGIQQPNIGKYKFGGKIN